MYTGNSSITSNGDFPPPMIIDECTLLEPYASSAAGNLATESRQDFSYYGPHLLDAFPEQRPSEQEIKDLIARHYDAVCERSLESDGSSSPISRYELALDTISMHVVAACAEFKKLNILSIGSGTARRERIIKNAFSDFISSFIVNDASLNMCHKAAALGFDFINGCWQDFAIREQLIKLDLILALDCSQHLSSKEEVNAFLSNAHSVLRKDGWLFMDFYNIEDNSGWGAELENRFLDERLFRRGYELGECFYNQSGVAEPNYRRYFSVDQVAELIDANGFELAEIEHIEHGTGAVSPNSKECPGNIIALLRRKS